MPEASSSCSVLISVPLLNLGFPKQSCSERISVFAVVSSKIHSYFSAAPTVWWQGVEEGGNSIASSLNVSLLEGLCLWAATFTGVSPVALPSPHAFYPFPGCMQYSQIISWKPWPLLTALFPLGETRMLEGTRVEGIPFLHLGSVSSKIFSMESRPCQGKGSGGYFDSDYSFSHPATETRASFSHPHHENLFPGAKDHEHMDAP